MLSQILEHIAARIYHLAYGTPPTMHLRTSEALPHSVDLRTSTCVPPPPIVNQKDVPMCAAVAFVSALHCCLRRQGLWNLPVSKSPPDVDQLYSHAQSCAVSNQGLTLACLLHSLLDLYGRDLEALKLGPKPVERHLIRHHLAAGTPLVVGYISDDRRENFQASASMAAHMNHELPPPLSTGREVGHCVILMGYTGERCLARNSTGSDWGMEGHFWFPLHMLEDARQTPDIWAFVPKLFGGK